MVSETAALSTARAKGAAAKKAEERRRGPSATPTIGPAGARTRARVEASRSATPVVPTGAQNRATSRASITLGSTTQAAGALIGVQTRAASRAASLVVSSVAVTPDIDVEEALGVGNTA